MNPDTFDNVIEFPNPEIQKKYERLVGLDHIKDHVKKEGRLLLRPKLLQDWSDTHYGKQIPLLDYFKEKPPLFIFAGDVGTGKTSLAETFGNIISTEEKIPITFYRLSLKTRGTGAVGEMTRLISAAFSSITDAAKKFVSLEKPASAAIILLIDEADALAQSRELAQMHHEDRAGVDALIQGIDAIASAKLPVLIVMCTNRINSIDPAVRRRAAAIFDFLRPNDEQRATILERALDGTGISTKEIQRIVKETGIIDKREYGYTHSDIMQKLLPNIILDAFPDKKIAFEDIQKILNEIKPTPPFKDEV